MWKMLLIPALLVGALFAAGAHAQSDVTPPVLVSVTVAPTLIDTSQRAVTLTVTARIIDDLSGCPEDDWCSDSGTPTDGVYQTTITLPRYSFQGEWQLTRFYIHDNVRNDCYWRSEDSSGDPCAFPIPTASFLNDPSATTARELHLPLLLR